MRHIRTTGSSRHWVVSAGMSIAAFVALAGGGILVAQAAAPQESQALPREVAPPMQFDVASIRRSPPDAADRASRMQPGGNYRATNLTLQQLVAIAYNVPTTRVLGGPSWAATDRYDIAAKAHADATSRDTGPLLQSLLRERFNLSVVHEKRPVPVFAPVIPGTERRLGAQLRPSTANCDDPEVRRRTNVAPSSSESELRPCALAVASDRFTGSGVLMSTFADVLARPAGRPVIDKTGLEGRFDIQLPWAATPEAQEASVFAAVQEQLGLKLQDDKAPLDVVVVQQLARPTENCVERCTRSVTRALQSRGRSFHMV